jgi:hypothetical protein
MADRKKDINEQTNIFTRIGIEVKHEILFVNSYRQIPRE